MSGAPDDRPRETDSLVDAIVASPGDDAPRLVWADREGGERGELVVLQCALAARRDDLSREDRQRMRARERELLLQHTKAWSPIHALASRVGFVRGFVERADISLPVLTDNVAEIFARAPLLNELGLQDTSGDVNRYAGPTADEAWAKIAASLAKAFDALPPGAVTSVSAYPVVHMSGDWADPGDTYTYGDSFAKVVADAKTLRDSLRSLTIFGAELTAAALEDLSRLETLERLHAHPRLDGAGCVALLRALPHLQNLVLMAGEPPLHGPDLDILLAAPELARLTDLEVRSTALDDDDLQRIAATPSLSRLKRLGLSFPAVLGAGAGGIKAIADSPHLSNLVELDAMRGIDDSALTVLASATFARQLRVLNLSYGTISSDDSVTSLLASFPALERLRVAHTRLSPQQIKALEAIIPEVQT